MHNVRKRRVLAAAAALLCVALLSACSLLPDIPTPEHDDSGQKADVVMRHIADAVTHHDAAALKKLFSPSARKKAVDLDAGLKYFLSEFPTGQMTWKVEDGGPGGTGDNDFPSFAELSFAFYKVVSNGKPYDLYFPQMITDTDHPDQLGIYALGVAPYSANPYSAPTAAGDAFFHWCGQFVLSDNDTVTGTPGVYIPPAHIPPLPRPGPSPDVEMQHIADALNHQDAAALEQLFPPQERVQSDDLERGVKYVLSVFPSGGVTWKPRGKPDTSEDPAYTKEKVAMAASYTLTANGKQYVLYLVDLTINQPAPTDLGLYSLGVAPLTSSSGNAMTPPVQFTWWKKAHVPYNGKAAGVPGIYIPQG